MVSDSDILGCTCARSEVLREVACILMICDRAASLAYPENGHNIIKAAHQNGQNRMDLRVLNVTHNDIIELLIRIYVGALEIAVVRQLVVHPIWKRGRQQGFPILQRLTEPNYVHVFSGEPRIVGLLKALRHVVEH
jgi:hypothetical protein